MLHLANALSQRIRLIITKALVDAVDDSTALQLLKIKALDSEVVEGVESIQQYGFSSVPPVDSEVVLVEVGGSRDNLLAIASDSSSSRPTGAAEGEVSVWSKHGQRIYQKSDGSILISASSGSIEIKDGTITVLGDLVVTGALQCTGQATFQSTIRAVGQIASDILIQAKSIVATLTGYVSLEKHIHISPGPPPIPGN